MYVYTTSSLDPAIAADRYATIYYTGLYTRRTETGDDIDRVILILILLLLLLVNVYIIMVIIVVVAFTFEWETWGVFVHTGGNENRQIRTITSLI